MASSTDPRTNRTPPFATAEDGHMNRVTSTEYDSPVGPVLLTFVDDALVCLDVAHDGIELARADISQRLGVLPDGDPSAGAALSRQLDEYFDGERRTFDVALDWRLVRGFTRAALEASLEIPYGEVASYGELAVMAGAPRAARAVGTACASSPFSIVVPVHRVVRADGSIGEYGGHPEVKQYLLSLENEAMLGEGLRVGA
jgi:methylated-DNA-[protein]-cysteine S-methyltransferase